MSKNLVRPKEILLTEAQRQELSKIAGSRTEKHARVERARFILDFASGLTIQEIIDKYHTNRVKVDRTLNKAIAYGVLTALNDFQGRGRKELITDAAKTWMLHIACTNPRELGLPFDVWSMEKLSQYYREQGVAKGYPFLEHIQKGTVCKLLKSSNIKPFKVRYFLESKDPQFETKMNQLLLVYKRVDLYLKKKNSLSDQLPPNPVSLPEEDELVVVSYDEKPGVQVLENAREDRYPLQRKGKNGTILRDYEYIRHGTISLLSGIDLLSGHIHLQIRDQHRSGEFIEFLKGLDAYYPSTTTIEIILDNHSIHTSKETSAYLKEHSGRFSFIFTPTHGSWLNLIEVFFSKLQRCLLANLRTQNKEECMQKIYQYIESLNQKPVVFKWSYKMDTIKIDSI